MRKLATLLVGILVLYGCQPTPETLTQQPRQPKAMTSLAISEAIDEGLRQQSPFNWQAASTDLLWNAAMQEDSLLVIGYQPEGFTRIDEQIHAIDVQSASWRGALDRVKVSVQNVYDELGVGLDIEDQVLNVHATLPYFHMKVTYAEEIERLRDLPQVRYVEPATYEPLEGSIADGLRTESKLGCGNDPENVPSSEFNVVSPSAKVPWNYEAMHIPEAWTVSRGDNIGIAIIDTGTSTSQDKLNNKFNAWFPSRYRLTFGTYVSSWWRWSKPDGPKDRCGHGTQMSGAAVAPRSSEGSMVGVAYESDFIGIRGTKDVVITSGREKDGVSDALVLAARRSDVKIISMSIGSPFSSGQVADAVRYAYGRGKMIFAAAGTSTSFTRFIGVVFPASMNETLAVTGVTENGEICNNCHRGKKVDFTAVMQRQGSGRVSLTLAQSGNEPSTVGGSSVATAMTAGIAALVWSKNPNQSRAQVLARLQGASERFPARSGNLGWGLINAFEAVQD